VELIAELLFQLVAWVLRFLGELIVQLFFEGIAELVGHSVKEPFRRPEPIHPWLATLGYTIFGAAAGGASLWLLPDLFIERGWLRWLNLLLVPLAAGAIMSAVGAWRRHRDMRVIRLDSFAYGYCFALAMAVVRFVWGQ
jgi:hypothetical protein